MRKDVGMNTAYTQVVSPKSIVLSKKRQALDSERPRKRRRTK
jgi:hypothetical protein